MQELSQLHRQKSSQVLKGALTECHPPTDDLWGLLHVIDGGDGKAPVGYGAPEVLQNTTQGKSRRRRERPRLLAPPTPAARRRTGRRPTARGLHCEWAVPTR